MHLTTPHPGSNSGRPEQTSASFLKRLGLAGVLFFTIKGLLWLVIPAALATLI